MPLKKYKQIKKSKQIWRENFSIRNCAYHMGAPAFDDMANFLPPIFSNILTEYIWVQKGDDNTGSYFEISQLRKFIDKVLQTILEHPAKINGIHRNGLVTIKEYFKYAHSLEKVNWAILSQAELIKKYERLIYWQMIHHGWLMSTTWFVDSDGEDLSRYLLDKATKLTVGSRLNVSDVFSTLTTPHQSSQALLEEKEALLIFKMIMTNPAAKKIFSQTDVLKIKNDLNQLTLGLNKKIIAHYNKWRWAPYTYTGPAYELDYYLALWHDWKKKKIDYRARLKELQNYSPDVLRKKASIIKKLKISPRDQETFKIAADIIYLKSFRKDAIFHGMYILDKILKEIGRRLNISLTQARYLTHWEVPAALRAGRFSEKVLNERRTGSVIFQKNSLSYIYSGDKAKKFLAGLNFEKKSVVKSLGLVGTVACPGQARGQVKIVNLPSEMSKMKTGDIMVAHTTFPSLVPAMKKAAAIITDDGGLTCHAAIVARELKKPCVVGTKSATSVLHDGDLVAVDASRGTIKIIKRK